MYSSFRVTLKKIFSISSLKPNDGIKITIFTFAMLISPIIASAEYTSCATTEVIYESKPAIKTECFELHSAESRLTEGINKRSSSFDESIGIENKIRNVFGLIITENEDGEKSYLQGFPDQRISYEGAELEKIYNIMLGRQNMLEPIRTYSQGNFFND